MNDTPKSLASASVTASADPSAARTLRAPEIRGVWAAVLLPLDDDERLLEDDLAAQVDHLVGCGVAGVYTNGTAGEFFNQSEDEFDRVQHLVAEKCRAGGKPFQIGLAHPCPNTVRERLRRCRALEPTAFQIILPDWLPTTAEEDRRFLEDLAAEAPEARFVLYNPPHAKKVLSPEAHGALAEAVPNLVGVKVADGNASWYAAMRKQLAGLSVFVPGHHMATGVLAGGAHGSYSNVASLGPGATQGWFDLLAEDPERGLALERRILAYFDDWVLPLARRGFSNPALDKFLAAVGGWASIRPRIRWPYASVPEAEVAPARAALEERLGEFLQL